jgi:peptide/nickel transport system substrate-binding protein
LVSLSNNSFRAELSAGRYDLYLGETNIHNNLDLGHLVKLNSARAFLSGAAAQTASSDTSSKKTENNTSSQTASQSEVVSNNLSTAEIYNGFYKGTYNVTDIVTVFNAELPVIPVCFRNGLVIYSKRLGNGINPVISDLFNNIENIK